MIAKLTHKLKVQPIAVDGEAFCSSLKEAAVELSGLPVDQLKLLYRGRTLPDDSTLKAVGFKDGGKIFIFESRQHLKNQATTSEEGCTPPEKHSDVGDMGDPAVQQMRKIHAEVTHYQKQVEVGLKDGFRKVNPAAIVHNLTQKLEELDGLSVSGDAREQRRSIIRSINELCDKVEGSM